MSRADWALDPGPLNGSAGTGIVEPSYPVDRP